MYGFLSYTVSFVDILHLTARTKY